MDVSQYLDVFINEAKENVQSLNTSLLGLESDFSNVSILNEIFRVAHTLKGMAGTMGFSRMTALTHHMEDVLDALRNKKLEANSNVVDILFKCLDALECYVILPSVSFLIIFWPGRISGYYHISFGCLKVWF